MNTQCPVCRRQIPPESIYIPDSGGVNLFVIVQKINPTWKLEEGFCLKCLAVFGKMLGDYRSGIGKSDGGYTKTSYRYHLTTEEHEQWHGTNPEIQKTSKDSIVEKVFKDALSQGYDDWLIFGVNEVMISQGSTQRPL